MRNAVGRANAQVQSINKNTGRGDLLFRCKLLVIAIALLVFCVTTIAAESGGQDEYDAALGQALAAKLEQNWAEVVTHSTIALKAKSADQSAARHLLSEARQHLKATYDAMLTTAQELSAKAKTPEDWGIVADHCRDAIATKYPDEEHRAATLLKQALQAITSGEGNAATATRPVAAADFRQSNHDAAQARQKAASGPTRPASMQIPLARGIFMAFSLIPPGSVDAGKSTLAVRKPYYLGQEEVSNRQWQAIMGDVPQSANIDLDAPVAKVTVGQVKTFLIKLSEITKLSTRLPTPEEWEYASRAGTSTPYYFGAALKPELANYRESQPVSVHEYPPNAWGLRNTHGNVWEFCEEVTASNPEHHVVKGGAFRNPPIWLANSYFMHKRDTEAANNTGFRILIEVTE